MRRRNLLLILIVLSLSILVSCREEQEVLHLGVNAEILEINEDEKAFLVRSSDVDSILGDKSYVKTEDADYIELVDDELVFIEFKDFSVGDSITVDVVNVLESDPTQTSTKNVQLIERAKANYNRIGEYMKEESTAAFSQYYELLDFQISNYEEEMVDGNIEATFFYKIIEKNFDKDPDTVGYIKEAKENENKHYQQLYDEYLAPREMNFDLKVVIDENDEITLYSNISPKGIKWEETVMTDYIIKD
jgi:hypothetical protein